MFSSALVIVLEGLERQSEDKILVLMLKFLKLSRV